mgnify:CR=1 FL=1|tara:strand:- start:826 stop:1365 length:540 start_codon:yes stop_codon:yes gene_type:complete
MTKHVFILLTIAITICCKQNNKELTFQDSSTKLDSISTQDVYVLGKKVYKKKDSTLVSAIVENYFDTGELKQTKTYKNGILDGPRRVFRKNGDLQQEGTYNNGKINGYRRAWNKDGILIGEKLYENGIVVGLEKRWHDNGNLKSEVNYENGKINGKAIKYNEDGEITEEKNYIDGKLIN